MDYLEKRKFKIAEAASTVFHEKGFINSNMKDIMKAAGVSRGGLYNHFENIQDVFLESLQIDDKKQLEAIVLVNEDYFESLILWVSNVLIANKYLFRAKIEFFFQYDEKNFPYLKERYEILLENLKRYIESGIDSKQFKEIDSENFTHYLIATIDGLLLNNRSDDFIIEKQMPFLKEALFAILKEE